MTPGSPTLVGRNRELRLIDQYLDDAQEGHGNMVLIGAEAGTGKTAVVERLAAVATVREQRVFIEAGYDLEVTPHFSPKRDAGLLPGMTSERDGPATSRPHPGDLQRFFGQLADTVTALAQEGSLAIILENLH